MATRYVAVKDVSLAGRHWCQQADSGVSRPTLIARRILQTAEFKTGNTGCRSLDRNHVGVRDLSMRDVKGV